MFDAVGVLDGSVLVSVLVRVNVLVGTVGEEVLVRVKVLVGTVLVYV